LLSEKSQSELKLGRYENALKLGLQSYPDPAAADPRPWTAESEAALAAASIDSPLLYSHTRQSGKIANIYFDAKTQTSLIMSFGGVADLLSAREAAQWSSTTLNELEHDEVSVPCRQILKAVSSCARYHGYMSGGCLNPRILPGYNQGKLFETCMTQNASLTDGALDAEALGHIATMPSLKDVTVSVERDLTKMINLIATDPTFTTFAGYDSTKRRVALVDIKSGHETGEYKSQSEVVKLFWLSQTKLAIVRKDAFEVYDNAVRDSRVQVDNLVAANTFAAAGVPTIVGVTDGGVIIVLDEKGEVSQVRGAFKPFAGVRYAFFSDGSAVVQFAKSGSALRGYPETLLGKKVDLVDS
jgi:hypothetical protein